MGALDGRIAIVTGASRGIGAAVARRLASEGAAVAVSARTVEPDDHPLPGTIGQVAAAIADDGGRALAVRADLAAAEDRRTLVETVVRELGPPDILVNNAAVTYFQPVDTFPDRRVRLMFEVQVFASVDLAQLVVPYMREKGGGWICNISSKAALHPRAGGARARGGTVYGMCKAALERFSTGLAAELYEDGIAVNALSPSKVVPTPGVLHHRLIPPGREDDAEPVEVMAEATLALSSGDPRELTGRIAYSAELLEELGREPTPLGS